jgi:hypothetical protein
VSDKNFCRGKIATAAFLAKNMLANPTAVRGIIESVDDDVMQLPEKAALDRSAGVSKPRA